MNILNNKNKRISIFKALALCLFAAVSLTLASCDDDMDIQQSYPFTVETMPVPNKVTKGQTVEIRCELKRTGDYANTLYTIRYFQFEGEGTLKMAGGITFLPNDRYLLENEKFLLCSLLAVCSVSARDSRRKGTDRQAAIYRLPPFERAVRCTKYFEGWHSEKHHPYVGWGHQVQPGERYSARTMTKRQADALLRKDLRKFCAMFRKFGRDSLLLATLAYNVGPYRLLGSGKIPKSTLIRKLEAGDRNIYREYIAFCNYKGKRHAMLLKRRKAEFALLYIP